MERGVRLCFSPYPLLYVEFHPRHWLVYLADEPHNLTSGAVPSYHLLFSPSGASLLSHSPLFCFSLFPSFTRDSLRTRW